MRSMRFLMLMLALPCVSLVVLGCEATMPPPPPNIPVPPASGKAQLDDEDIQAARLPLNDTIDSCVAKYQDGNDKAEAVMIVAPTGEVTDVSIQHLLNFTQKRCLARAARAAKFPAFGGPAMRVVWSMTMSKKTDKKPVPAAKVEPKKVDPKKTEENKGEDPLPGDDKKEEKPEGEQPPPPPKP